MVRDGLAHQMATLEKEVEFLCTLSHPNVVRVFGKTDTEPGMVMEYVPGGDLKRWITAARVRCQTNPSSTYDELVEGLRLLHGVACGMRYLHEHMVVHCDLKPMNVLLGLSPDGKRQQARVADFGMATRYNPSTPVERTDGTTSYMAPEAKWERWEWFGDHLFGKGLTKDEDSSTLPDVSSPSAAPSPVVPGPILMTPAIDVWSFGVTLSCVVSIEPRAWTSASDHRQSVVVSGEAIGALEEVKRRFGLDVVGLLQRCLSRLPLGRPSFDEIVRELEAVVEVEEGVEETKE